MNNNLGLSFTSENRKGRAVAKTVRPDLEENSGGLGIFIATWIYCHIATFRNGGMWHVRQRRQAASALGCCRSEGREWWRWARQQHTGPSTVGSICWRLCAGVRVLASGTVGGMCQSIWMELCMLPTANVKNLEKVRPAVCHLGWLDSSKDASSFFLSPSWVIGSSVSLWSLAICTVCRGTLGAEASSDSGSWWKGEQRRLHIHPHVDLEWPSADATTRTISRGTSTLKMRGVCTKSLLCWWPKAGTTIRVS